ncbi:DUF167 domain-containing protein [Silvibacterium dinghuense]|uniref:UPF0235 protein ESZ00_16830 n=1 Tax=Silvibacterium dinghuense TaxID=1560006 RepID=A0A4Q1SAJ1_9BACT|nr:DUF167 domain-containing protein [Silvibacterium dinghuense]
MRDEPGGVTIAVRVTPRASRSKITGIYEDPDGARVKIALAAPPVDGKANDALLAFMADVLGVPRSTVTLVAGDTSRSKRLRVAGILARDVCALLDRR